MSKFMIENAQISKAQTFQPLVSGNTPEIVNIASTLGKVAEYHDEIERTNNILSDLVDTTDGPRVKIRGVLPKLSFAQTTTGSEYDNNYCGIIAYPGTNGTQMTIQSGGNMIIGSGEYPTNWHNLADKSGGYPDYWADNGETTYIGSDNNVIIHTNANTIANRKTFTFGTNFNLALGAAIQFRTNTAENPIVSALTTAATTTSRMWTLPDATGTLVLNDTGKANCLSYYSNASTITKTEETRTIDGSNYNEGLSYHVVDSTASTPSVRTILNIYGKSFGNNAATLISGTAGLLSYGDGGPQINFSPNGSIDGSNKSNQLGALLFTDHDQVATGVSWSFVSNQSDWNVISKRFHARTGITIGTDIPESTSNNLVVHGKSRILNTNGGSWISARSNAPIYVNYNATTDNVFHPLAFMKTYNGGWSIGVIPGTMSTRLPYNSTVDRLIFSYTNDSDYSGGTNTDKHYTIDSNGVFSGRARGIAEGCQAIGGNTSNYPYHRIASKSNLTTTYGDSEMVLLIDATHNSGKYGIVKVAYRTNGSGAATTVSIEWLVRAGFNLDDVAVATWGTTGQATYVDVFLKCGTYPRTNIYCLGGLFNLWTFHNSEEVNDTTTTDKKTSYEVYATIAAAGTEIHNKAYTSTYTSGSDKGAVYSATNATKVYSTLTNPSSNTTYHIPFHTNASSENKSLCNNNGIKYITNEGTTSAYGEGTLVLGNSIATGTAGNKKAFMRLYGGGSGYTTIALANTSSSNYMATIPAASGNFPLYTVLYTSTTAPSSTSATINLNNSKTIIGVYDYLDIWVYVGGTSRLAYIKLPTFTAALSQAPIYFQTATSYTTKYVYLGSNGYTLQFTTAGSSDSTKCSFAKVVGVRFT